jgi:hypothetical protein
MTRNRKNIIICMLCPRSTIKRSSAKAVEMVLGGGNTQAAEDRLELMKQALPEDLL